MEKAEVIRISLNDYANNCLGGVKISATCTFIHTSTGIIMYFSCLGKFSHDVVFMMEE